MENNTVAFVVPVQVVEYEIQARETNIGNARYDVTLAARPKRPKDYLHAPSVVLLTIWDSTMKLQSRCKMQKFCSSTFMNLRDTTIPV